MSAISLSFTEFRMRVVAGAQGAQRSETPDQLLALDPGETTGWAFFSAGVLTSSGQLATRTIAESILEVDKLIKHLFAWHSTAPAPARMIVFEDYKIYAWKTDQHTWASLHTPQLLGVIETLALVLGIETRRQMAMHPKQFCTDDKLKMWGYYVKGQRHARDAIRHGCYYLLFGK